MSTVWSRLEWRAIYFLDLNLSSLHHFAKNLRGFKRFPLALSACCLLKPSSLQSGNDSRVATSSSSSMSRAVRQESPSWSSCRRQEQRGSHPHSLTAMEHQVVSGTLDGGAGLGPSRHKTVRSKRHLEGVLKKYTNLLQGWQSR